MKSFLVWCVFYVSEETLNWELDSIWSQEEDAKSYLDDMDDDDLEYKVEEWSLS